MQSLASRSAAGARRASALGLGESGTTTSPPPTITLGCARLRRSAMLRPSGASMLRAVPMLDAMLPTPTPRARAHHRRRELVAKRSAAAAAASPVAAAAAASASSSPSSAQSAAAAAAAALDDDDEFEEEEEFEEGDDDQDFAPGPPPPVDEAALALAVDLARVASAAKASDVMVLDVAPLISWTSYLVIASVASRPQLMAVLSRCEQKASGEPHGAERRNNPTGRSQWECLDLGSVVVHVMTPAQREAYALEDFYGAADEVQWWGQEEGEGEGGRDGARQQQVGGDASLGAWTTRTKGQ